MKRRKSQMRLDLERAARPARRRNRQASGVTNMVEQLTVFISKGAAAALRVEMEALGPIPVNQAEFLGSAVEGFIYQLRAVREAAIAAASPIIQPDFKVVDGAYVGRRG